MWANFGAIIDNSFFFVIDKIIDLQNFFMKASRGIGYIVLLIALLSAALNYALTGTGLKENIIKIMKASLFFFIVIAAYPRIIGGISSMSISMAMKSVYPSVKDYFGVVITEVESKYDFEVSVQNNTTKTFTNTFMRQIKRDNQALFSNLTKDIKHSQMNYTSISPANVIKVVFLLAQQCIGFADDKRTTILPEFSRILKGLVCGFFLIATGVFAILEYCVCFMEFMLVASVGVILLPLSIWEGSKFLSEKFIGAIVGFFMKLLFCNIAIFLMLYGFITIFYVLDKQGFNGHTDQIAFIAFTSLMFFFICKSAPALAQSLLTGTPSLTGAGAIAAVSGAVGAAASTASFIKSKGGAIKDGAKSIAGGVANTANTFAQAGAAAKAAGIDGGSRMNQAGAFLGSLGDSASRGLARSLYGNQSGGKSMGERSAEAKQNGANMGTQHMNKVRQRQGSA